MPSPEGSEGENAVELLEPAGCSTPSGCHLAVEEV